MIKIDVEGVKGTEVVKEVAGAGEVVVENTAREGNALQSKCPKRISTFPQQTQSSTSKIY